MNKLRDMSPESVDVNDLYDEIERLDYSVRVAFKNILILQQHLNAALYLLQKNGVITEEGYTEAVDSQKDVLEKEIKHLDELLSGGQPVENQQIKSNPILYFGPIGEA